MNVKDTRRKNQVVKVNIFEQQEMLAKAEEIRNTLKALICKFKFHPYLWKE